MCTRDMGILQVFRKVIFYLFLKNKHLVYIFCFKYVLINSFSDRIFSIYTEGECAHTLFFVTQLKATTEKFGLYFASFWGYQPKPLKHYQLWEKVLENWAEDYQKAIRNDRNLSLHFKYTTFLLHIPFWHFLVLLTKLVGNVRAADIKIKWI